jgi:hypothetical protein
MNSTDGDSTGGDLGLKWQQSWTPLVGIPLVGISAWKDSKAELHWWGLHWWGSRPERTAKLNSTGGDYTVYLRYRFVILTPAEIIILTFLIYTGEDENGEHKVDFIDIYDNILFTYFDTQITQGTYTLCVECGRTYGKRQRRWHLKRCYLLPYWWA